MTSPHERRREPRAVEQLTLDLQDAATQLTAETKNLSASGAYCTLERFIPPMSKLQLHFELPGNGTRRSAIRCSGVVVRVEPVIAPSGRGSYHIAILFTELSARDRSAISSFVRQRLSGTSSAH